MFLISICDIILSFQTWEFRASAFKHWNSGTICVHVGILALFFTHWNYPLSFQTFEFWSYSVNHWNSDPILTNIGILILSFHWKQRISGVILPNTGILAYYLYTLVFWSYPSKRWNSYIVLLNIWTLALYFTHWKFDIILRSIGILAYFYKHCIFIVSFHWPYFYKRWNFYVTLPNIAVQAISLYTFKFLSYPSKLWNLDSIFIHCHSRPIFIPLAFLCYPSKRSNFDPIFIHIGFLILSFKTLEFWPFFGTYWNSYLIISRTGILALFL